LRQQQQQHHLLLLLDPPAGVEAAVLPLGCLQAELQIAVTNMWELDLVVLPGSKFAFEISVAICAHQWQQQWSRQMECLAFVRTIKHSAAIVKAQHQATCCSCHSCTVQGRGPQTSKHAVHQISSASTQPAVATAPVRTSHACRDDCRKSNVWVGCAVKGLEINVVAAGWISGIGAA
jgi:hypothetical protein